MRKGTSTSALTVLAVVAAGTSGQTYPRASVSASQVPNPSVGEAEVSPDQQIVALVSISMLATEGR